MRTDDTHGQHPEDPTLPTRGRTAGTVITVRPACPEDAGGIYEVVSDSMKLYCGNSGIQPDKLDAVSETVEDVRTAIMTVPVFIGVDADGSILGSVRLLSKKISSFGTTGLAGILSLSPDDSVSYFSRFAVREDLHGKGVGSRLYRAAEEKARETRSEYILLHTSLLNQVLVAFYERRGFVLLSEDYSRGYPRGLFGKKLA